ncbi:MAG: nitroreductase family protein [Bacteroidales bacterium]|jgi:nitroreductase|nr:nitroreductase family protein [Bacteroidales bacterium]
MKKLILCVVALIACSCAVKETPKTTEDMNENPVIENILNRKSVRKYTEQKIEKEKVDLLVRAAFAAPSGKNIRPWEIIVVDDVNILKSWGEQLHNAPMLKNAPLAIIVAGDTVKSSYWYLDCSAATQNVLLAAKALGLGGVWTAAWPYVDRIEVICKDIKMPETVKPLAVIPIGYPLDPNREPMNKYDESKIHYNRW